MRCYDVLVFSPPRRDRAPRKVNSSSGPPEFKESVSIAHSIIRILLQNVIKSYQRRASVREALPSSTVTAKDVQAIKMRQQRYVYSILSRIILLYMLGQKDNQTSWIYKC